MTNKAVAKKINVNEIRDKVFADVIDYAHNVRKGETVYHPGFSPNNIRRLVICPDRVVAYYYVTRKNDKQIPLDRNASSSLFPASKLAKYAQQMDYKPLISVLSDPLVSASIQEVLFVTDACNEPVQLSNREFDLSCLVKSYNNKQADLMETIKKRYKRLAYISVFRGNYNDLKASMGEQKTNFFCEKEGILQHLIKQIPLNVDTWYDNWGQNAADAQGLNGYQLDNVGSALNNYFKQVQAKNRAKKEVDGYEQYKAARAKVGSVIAQAFETNLTSYKNYLTCLTLLKKKLDESHNVLYSHTLTASVPPLVVNETECYKANEKDKKYGITTHELSSSVSANDAVKQDIQNLKTRLNRIYATLLSALSKEMAITATNYGDELLRVVAHDFDNVLVSKGLGEEAIINKLCQKEMFKGERLKDAMANACSLMCLLYLSKRTDKDVDDCFTKDYWYKVLDA